MLKPAAISQNSAHPAPRLGNPPQHVIQASRSIYSCRSRCHKDEHLPLPRSSHINHGNPRQRPSHHFNLGNIIHFRATENRYGPGGR